MNKYLFTAKTLMTSMFLLCFSTMAFSFDTPEAAVNSYITGVKTGSGEHVIAAFSESASIQYYDQDGQFRVYTRADFAELVDSGNQWNAQIDITAMKKTVNAANATVEFTWGDNGEKGYVDYLNLIYDGKSWKVTDKVAQFVNR